MKTKHLIIITVFIGLLMLFSYYLGKLEQLKVNELEVRK
jgi:hypothetical protein